VKDYNGFSAKEREDAYEWLKEQWRLGKRPKPEKCCACGQTEGVLMAHSEDYSKPYGDNIDRYPLCYICHMMVHCRFRNPEKFAAYAKIVSAGGRFKAFPGANWDGFRRAFLVAQTLPQHKDGGEPNNVLERMLQEGQAVIWRKGLGGG
jgi:hypothetical protein